MVGTLVSYRAGEYDYYAPDGRMRMSRSMEAQMGGVFQLFSLVCSGSSRNVTESFLCASDRKWSKDPEIDRVIAWRGGVEGGPAEHGSLGRGFATTGDRETEVAREADAAEKGGRCGELGLARITDM